MRVSWCVLQTSAGHKPRHFRPHGDRQARTSVSDTDSGPDLLLHAQPPRTGVRTRLSRHVVASYTRDVELLFPRSVTCLCAAVSGTRFPVSGARALRLQVFHEGSQCAWAAGPWMPRDPLRGPLVVLPFCQGLGINLAGTHLVQPWAL